MTQIVDAHVVKAGAGPDAPPGVLQVGERLARHSAGYHPGVIFDFLDPGQNLHRGPADMDDLFAGLGVR